MICEKCGLELHISDWPFCPHGRGHSNVIGDECDFVQENGFAQPTRFRSKAEFKRALAEKGLQNEPCNAGIHDTLVPRMVTMDPYTLWAAEQLAKRHGGTTIVERDPHAVDVTWTIRDV